jgi:hypothetical protein
MSNLLALEQVNPLTNVIQQYPIRNTDQLEARRQNLTQQFYVLDLYLDQFSKDRIIRLPSTGEQNISKLAINSYPAPIQHPCLDRTIRDLTGINAILEEHSSFA